MAGYADFQQAASSRGLLEPFHQDGKPHRCPATGDKAGQKSSWYIWRRDNSGLICNWRDGLGCESFFPKGQRLSTAERAARSEQIRLDRLAFEQEQAACHEKAAKKAVQIWEASKPVTNTSEHAYLAQKCLKSAFEARLYNGLLVVPVRDRAGNIWSLQFVSPDGSKRFLSGGKKSGLFFHISGAIDRFYICEGFATGATVAEITGCMVIVAFDAGNLLPVTRTVRGCFPLSEIVIAADDDWKTPNNPGKTKARQVAALVSNVKVLLPDFTGLPRKSTDTDFNDWYCLELQQKRESHDHAA